jgi:hypothetical protein
MRTRILAIALAATAASVGMAAPASASGQCSGTYDTNCYTWVCNRNCLEVNCAVWTDVVPGYQGGCFG